MNKKITFFSAAAALFLLTACGNEASNTSTAETPATTPEVTTPAASSSVTDGMVDNYLRLKDALVADNSNGAAEAGKALVTEAKKLDGATLTAEQKTVWADVKEDLLEHAEHIGENADNLHHQREHFDRLSKDMADLLQVAAPGQTLYKAHCPMFNKNKGAVWFSRSTTIENPYYGKKMMDCGTIQDTLAP